MSKDFTFCEDCSDEFCANCFNLTPCDVCQKEVCEDCFDKAKECECGSRNCDECGHECDFKNKNQSEGLDE